MSGEELTFASLWASPVQRFAPTGRSADSLFNNLTFNSFDFNNFVLFKLIHEYKKVFQIKLSLPGNAAVCCGHFTLSLSRDVG